MANMEHVQLVRRGRDHVARWREANPTEPLDLNAAYMSYVRASQVDISGADLRNSDLMGAVMRRGQPVRLLSQPQPPLSRRPEGGQRHQRSP